MPIELHDTITVGRGVKIPIFALLAAIPDAIAAAKAQGADDRDTDSPGGATVTAGEVAEDIGAFLLALGEAALPELLRINGK